MQPSMSLRRRLAALAFVVASCAWRARAQCVADAGLDESFAKAIGEDSIPTSGSCCQQDVCNLPCPEPVPPPTDGFGIALIVAIIIFVLIGFLAYFFVGGVAENFFVAGRTLPLFVVSLTLASQSIDSNALLGNADLSYKYQYWDGAVLPIGLGLSLLLNGFFLARHVNQANVLTLPEIYGNYYGPAVEVCVSLICCASFLSLLAGNLVGMSVILGYLFSLGLEASVFISGAVLFVYTASGGLFSVAYSDVVQASVGITGCAIIAFWWIANAEEPAPPPSIGFPGYTYPDNKGDGGACDLYEGVSCSEDKSLCCYNEKKWCPDGLDSDNCRTDNGAYPFGDLPIFYNGMSEPSAYAPFPNAIFWNWATIFVLGFGNLAALDFQARCMAAKTPRVATIGNLIAGCLTFIVGIPFAYLGAITRFYYGPDSVHAEFVADTCSRALGLPQCGLWAPDPDAFIKLLTHQAPPFLGGWCLIGIVAASMSTSDGAILALSTVVSHNLARKLPIGITEKNLLLVARISAAPITLIACLIAAFYKSEHSAGATGYLLIVAFDIMLSGCIVPLFACFYLPDASPTGALASVVGGSLLRLILEFSLPKDGFLILPWPGDEFLDYGAVSTDKLPAFLDVADSDKWDPTTCQQRRLEDYTGVDSLTAPVFSAILFFGIHFYEKRRGSRLLTQAWMQPTKDKDAEKEAQADEPKATSTTI